MMADGLLLSYQHYQRRQNKKKKKHLNPLRSGAMEGMETVDMEQLCFFESMVV